jgi:hypothetical protein
MRRYGVVLAFLLLAAPTPAVAAPAATVPTGRALAGLSQYRFTLLGLHADPAAERLLAGRGGTIVAPQLHIWRLPSATAQRLIPRLRRSGALRYAEADRPVFRAGHLDGGDPLAAPAIGWHHYHVGANRVEPPGPGVPITIIDSGLDIGHMEFSTRPNTFLLNQQHTDMSADEYHGTIVASTAAAPTDARGAVGIYPQAVLRAYDLDYLTEDTIVAGISRAVAAGRSVINLSLGGDEPSRSIYEAAINAFGRGSIVVAAAGNDRLLDDPPIYPADFPHVLTVGSTNQIDQPSDFSSTSGHVDLAAPGEQIPWQHPVDPAVYGLASGTSFAAPMVTAATAWVLTTAAPPPDPLEPNDDIDHVKAHGIFQTAAKPLMAPGRSRAAFQARVDASEDPHDVYRVWVKARSRLSVTVRPNADVNAALWAPATTNVAEKGPLRRQHLLASGTRNGTRTELLQVENKAARGHFTYLDVFPAKQVRSAAYALGVSSRALPSRPSTRR